MEWLAGFAGRRDDIATTELGESSISRIVPEREVRVAMSLIICINHFDIEHSACAVFGTEFNDV
jgi:hypothetical protein